MKGIGALVIIGLILWGFSKALPARAAEGVEEVTPAGEPSLYEKMHTIVPITSYREKEIPVFKNFEEYREANRA